MAHDFRNDSMPRTLGSFSESLGSSDGVETTSLEKIWPSQDAKNATKPVVKKKAAAMDVQSTPGLRPSAAARSASKQHSKTASLRGSGPTEEEPQTSKPRGKSRDFSRSKTTPFNRQTSAEPAKSKVRSSLPGSERSMKDRQSLQNRGTLTSQLASNYIEAEQSIDDRPNEAGLARPGTIGDRKSMQDDSEGAITLARLPRYTRALGRKSQEVNATASTLNAMSQSRVLRAVPTRLQVRLARQFRHLTYDDPVDDLIFEAGSKHPDHNRFLVIEQGVCELLVKGANGVEVVIGRVGAGSVLGGTVALGLTESHLMSVRRIRTEDDSAVNSQPSEKVTKKGSITHVASIASHKGMIAVSQPLLPITCYYIAGQEIADFAKSLQEDVDYLRYRVLKDLREFVLPHLARVAAFSFFRRYTPAFIKNLVQDMDIRICKPSELIFRHGSVAASMAMLFCGEVDVFVKGRKVATHCHPGTCFGEAALLEDNAVRTATVRCGPVTECIVCLMAKQDFMRTIDRFPEEKTRLSEQVRQKMMRIGLHETFPRCSPNFLDLLSMIGDCVILKYGQLAYDVESDTPEELFICRQGTAIVERNGEVQETLEKGDVIGCEAALGLRTQAPPDYSILGGTNGTLLVRMSYSAFETALMYFPKQLGSLLSAVGLEEVPEDHPFKGKEQVVLELVQRLMCIAFSTLNIDIGLCTRLEPFFRVEIYDAGVTIATEGEEAEQMTLLLYGRVSCKREGKLNKVLVGPCVFHEDVTMGFHSQYQMGIVAASPCIVWHFPLATELKVQHRQGNEEKVDAAKSMLGHIHEAHAMRKSFKTNTQARLRNMKTFRKFRSEILELISQNMEVTSFLPGDNIFEEGEEGDCMYILLKGKAEATSNGRSVNLDEGVTLGEMVLFGQGKRTMTVRAISLCVCDVVHKEIMDYAFNEFPELAESAGENKLSQMVHNLYSPSAPPAPNKLKHTVRKTICSIRFSEKKSVAQIAPRKTGGPGQFSEFENLANQQKFTHRRTIRGSHIVPLKTAESAPRSGSPSSDDLSEDEAVASPTVKAMLSGVQRTGSTHARLETPEHAIIRNDSGDFKKKRHKRGSISVGTLMVGNVTSHAVQFDSEKDEIVPVSVLHSEETLAKTAGDEAEPLVDNESSHVLSSLVQDSFSDVGDDIDEPGPHQLQQRFDNRSCLFNVTAPRLPKVVTKLYQTPRTAELSVSSAFTSVMPFDAVAATSRMHGVLPKSRLGDNGENGSVSSRAERRCWPTYTDPLPPLARPLPLTASFTFDVGLTRPKEADRSVGIAGKLQVLAASLLRINTKSQMGLLSHSETEDSVDLPLIGSTSTQDALGRPGSQKSSGNPPSRPMSSGNASSRPVSRKDKVARLKRAYMGETMSEPGSVYVVDPMDQLQELISSEIENDGDTQCSLVNAPTATDNENAEGQAVEGLVDQTRVPSDGGSDSGLETGEPGRLLSDQPNSPSKLAPASLRTQRMSVSYTRDLMISVADELFDDLSSDESGTEASPASPDASGRKTKTNILLRNSSNKFNRLPSGGADVLRGRERLLSLSPDTNARKTKSWSGQSGDTPNRSVIESSGSHIEQALLSPRWGSAGGPTSKFWSEPRDAPGSVAHDSKGGPIGSKLESDMRAIPAHVWSLFYVDFLVSGNDEKMSSEENTTYLQEISYQDTQIAPTLSKCAASTCEAFAQQEIDSVGSAVDRELSAALRHKSYLQAARITRMQVSELSFVVRRSILEHIAQIAISAASDSVEKLGSGFLPQSENTFDCQDVLSESRSSVHEDAAEVVSCAIAFIAALVVRASEKCAQMAVEQPIERQLIICPSPPEAQTSRPARPPQAHRKFHATNSNSFGASAEVHGSSSTQDIAQAIEESHQVQALKMQAQQMLDSLRTAGEDEESDFEDLMMKAQSPLAIEANAMRLKAQQAHEKAIVLQEEAERCRQILLLAALNGRLKPAVQQQSQSYSAFESDFDVADVTHAESIDRVTDSRAVCMNAFRSAALYLDRRLTQEIVE